MSPTLLEQIKYFPSKTVLTTSGSPSLIKQPVTFTATVTSTHGTIPDGELVTFYDGQTTLGSVPLAGGKAGSATSFLSARTHTIKATYAGGTKFWDGTIGIGSATLSGGVAKLIKSTLGSAEFSP